jgi:hypothetical protein
MPATMPSQTREQALLTTRILWGALLVAPLILFGALSTIIFGSAPRPQNADDLMKILPFICGAVAIIEIPVLYFVRSVIFKKQRENDVVTPQGYLSGSLIFFAGCEGLMLFVIVCCMLTRNAVPTGLPALLPLAAMLASFPNGRAMYPEGEMPNPYNPDAQ